MRGAAALAGGMGAYAKVGSGRLSSKEEKQILAYIIFMFYNVLMTNDEANMLYAILRRDGTLNDLAHIEDPMEWQQVTDLGYVVKGIRVFSTSFGRLRLIMILSLIRLLHFLLLFF